MAFSADGRQIITGSDGRTVKLWESASVEEVAQWHPEEMEADQRIKKMRTERIQAETEKNAQLTGGSQ